MADRIEVDLSERTLTLWRNGRKVKAYPVAVGKPSSPTPTGHFTIVEKARVPDPVYGFRWLGLSKPGYGIHGTNSPALIGRRVSKGCVRMRNQDIAELFGKVAVGTPVHIHP